MLSLSLALLLAASGDAAATEKLPTAKPAKVKKICRNDGPTGTRMAKKKCMTAEEWAEYDRANQMKLGTPTQR